MKKTILLSILFLNSLLIFSQHTNIRIDGSGVNSPNEPSIVINPANTMQLIAGSNLNYFYVSNDGGITWTGNTLQSNQHGVWGDPCVIADSEGTFYYLHLANPPSGNWIDRIVCQKTTDLGTSWNDGTAIGLNGTKAQDKEWAVVDQSRKIIYTTWTQFDDYASSSSQDSSIIRFSKSIDGGLSWTSPIRINKIAGDCEDDDNTVEGAVPTVGPNGEIYVSWASPQGIVFDKSLDFGDTWLDDDIFISTQPGGWAQEIPGIQRCNGMPVTMCDTSNSPYKGTIYINWTDQRNGFDDTDVFLSKSTDGGETWCTPIRVNNDAAGKQQFFTWATIDQSNGNLYFIFYDRRNYDNKLTDVYMAVSEDGGENFTNFKISEEPFNPSSDVFFGDYTNVTAYNNIIRPIWTRLHNYSLSLYTAIIDITTIVPDHLEEGTVPFSVLKSYPNPFRTNLNVAFKVHESSNISISLYDITGKKIASLIKNKNFSKGKYIKKFNSENFNLKNGFYYLRIVSNNEYSITQKVLYSTN